MTKIYLLSIIIIELFVGLILVQNSYGTGDVRVVESWVRDFFKLGFWEGFSKNSTYPHILTQIFYFTGVISKLISGNPVGQLFVVLHKQLAYIVFILIGLIFYSKAKDDLGRVLGITVALNPAILLHTTILGFMDSFYILMLIISIIFLAKLLSGDLRLLNFLIAVLAIFFGPMLKWQFLYFYPIFIGALIYLIVVKKIEFDFKVALFTLLLFLLSILVPSGSLTIVERIYSLIISFARITSENFVVANFSNFWQIVNFFVHNCSFNYCVNLPRNMLLYWQDLSLMRILRIPYFLLMSIFLLIVLIKLNIVSNKINFIVRLKNKINWEIFLISLCIWFNIIYVIFNTGVHENHFIPSIVLSTFLVIKKRTNVSVFLLLFFSIFNFLNLLIFYHFGLTGVWGLNTGLMPIVVNFGSMSLSVLFLVVFIYLVYRLKSSNNESLGLS